MKIAAVVLSILIVAGFYWIEWSEQIQELHYLTSEGRKLADVRLAEIPDREASLPRVESEVKDLLARRRAAESRLKLPGDPPAREMQARLEREWAPLLKRAGLTVELKGTPVDASKPWLTYELTAEGPKDEVFRLFDGLLRSPRPVGVESLELKCDASRAQAVARLEIYHP